MSSAVPGSTGASGSTGPSIEVLPTIGTATPFSTDIATTVAAPTTTPPTVPHSTTTAAVGTAPLALDVLRFIVVENEHGSGYVRDLFGYPADLNHNGCNTRAEVLLRESLAPTTHSAGHCTVVTGRWVSPYDAFTGTSASSFQIDHMVPLKEAWDSGAWAWSASTRFAYGNDLTDVRTLRAVSAASNTAKSDKDPSNWLPPDQNDVCPYLSDWVAIKARWQLSMDASEYGRIRNLLTGSCAGTRMASWSPPPVPVPTRSATTTSVVQTPATTTATPSNVYYKNCAAAWAAGAAPLQQGQPGYRSGLDRDGDGVACEQRP
ncbi:MAG: excalibur calcium-binding domain-containing protein [Actinomycetota bacterium]